ncbi:MAG: GNAT family N-acetyltransferase [Acidobacteria bacterium]|nr:GNAT family N-acetyltransferase [Acidobacteriota bacterium]
MLFSDLDLARRIETADARGGLEYARVLARLHPDLGAAALEIAGGCAVYAGVGSPVTQAMALGLEGPVTEQHFEELESFFRSRGARTEIEVCPLAGPSLLELLGRRGYRVIEWSNVLAQSLSRAALDPPPPSAVGVRRAPPDEVDTWVHVMARCYFEHQEIDASLRAMFEPAFHNPNSVCFLAFLDGQPAGCGGLLIHDGVAQIAGAGTLPEYRNRGVQSALFHSRLEFALAAGCDLAVTMAQPGTASHRNAERHGFRVLYTRSKFAAG